MRCACIGMKETSYGMSCPLVLLFLALSLLLYSFGTAKSKAFSSPPKLEKSQLLMLARTRHIRIKKERCLREGTLKGSAWHKAAEWQASLPYRECWQSNCSKRLKSSDQLWLGVWGSWADSSFVLLNQRNTVKSGGKKKFDALPKGVVVDEDIF